MKKTLAFLFACGTALGIASAQTTTQDVASATPVVNPPALEAAAGLTPESSLYFLDKIAESLQELFAFTPESKVKLQLQFAAERVAEAKAMLKTHGDHTKGLDVIRVGLTENMQKTAEILKQEKTAGKDVSRLAKEANDQLDSEEGDLNSSLADAQKEVVDKKIEETKQLLEEARAAKDEAKIQAAEQDLHLNQQIAEDLKKKREEIQRSFHEDKKAIEDEMSADDQNEDQVTGENESNDASSTPDSNNEGDRREHRNDNASTSDRSEGENGSATGTRLRDDESGSSDGNQNTTRDGQGDRGDGGDNGTDN